jgi:outer membrane immunogenic protein
MKKILIAVALAGTTVGAQAADLPTKYTKAPPYMAPVYNWSGFYMGVNAGVGFGRSATSTNLSPADPTSLPTSRLGGLGGMGGAQIGYNWQYGNFLGLGNIVLGVETDIQGGGLEDSRTCTFVCVTPNGIAYDQKLDWLGTVRGRIGLATGSVLTYFTGGFAYGGVNTQITQFGTPTPTVNGFSETRTGWTIGSGIEAALGGNWTGKIEYLYVDLGTQTGGNLLAPVPYAFSSEIREQIFRVGLNYRIGPNGAYAPEPVAHWSGFYLGGNGGGATALNRSNLFTTAVGGNNERFNVSPDGYIGGAQIGYNWQAANWVFGIETDIQGSSQRDSKVCQFSCSASFPAIAIVDQKMDWFGTVRGRLGYSVGSSLFYATGGLAYGDVKTHIFGNTGLANIDSNISHTKTGYAVGGGLESPFDLFGWFGKNWTTKTEYLYVDLGRTTDAIGTTGLNFSTRAQEHVFRSGLNYYFGGPVVAKY